MEIRLKEASPTAEAIDMPRGTRGIVLALLSTSIAINLIDRQVLSVVSPVMRTDLHFSNTDYAYIVCAFQLGMFLGQIPAGALMDKLGTKIGLAMAFLAWSVLNASHALATALALFV